MSEQDYGYLVEGTVEENPATGALTIRTEKDGCAFNFNPLDALRAYQGQEVRLTLVSHATMAHLQKLLEEAQRK